MKLYHYWRSSCSWRVRWALNLKKIPHELVVIDLLKGEQKSDDHLKRNPMGLIPVLEWKDQNDQTQYLSDSIAILKYLDRLSTYGEFLSFPQDPIIEANVFELVGIISSGTQPIQNLQVMRFHSEDKEDQKKWANHWINRGLSAYEKSISDTAGEYSLGDQITAADLCLIPQCYNAVRFGVDLSQYPTIHRVNENCLKTSECQMSAPENFKPSED